MIMYANKIQSSSAPVHTPGGGFRGVHRQAIATYAGLSAVKRSNATLSFEQIT